jgi:hypothetical protein
MYGSNKDEISRDRLDDADVMVFGGSRERFAIPEFDELKLWLNGGGRALILLSDGGDSQSGSNFNLFLKE